MIIKNNIFFIPFKWIFLLLLTSLYSFGSNNLKRVNITDYISDYEEYNEEIINVKKNPNKKSKNNHQVAIKTITKIATILNKEMLVKKEKSEKLATIIAFAGKKYDIDPRIMIAIMKVESNFKQNAINLTSCERTKKEKCGDYSIAQINYEIWSESFPRLGKAPLDLHKLKTNESYAIFRMAEILSILKKDFASSDKFWFARYHSSTPEHKNRYQLVLKKELKKIISLGPNLLKDFPKNTRSILD